MRVLQQVRAELHTPLSLVVASTCDSSLTVSHNNTYIRNPSYPSALSSSTSTQTCGYKVQKLNDQICQLRLDFENLELGQTASSGVCTDTLQVTASVDSPATLVSPPSPCHKSQLSLSGVSTQLSAAPPQVTTCTSTSAPPRAPRRS